MKIALLSALLWMNAFTNPNRAPEPEAALNRIQYMLTGYWSNASYPYDIITDLDECGAFEAIDGAYLHYEFRADGTYTRYYGSKHIQLREDGRYELSRSGEYLIFINPARDADSDASCTNVAKIAHLATGELVLELALETVDFADFFCTKYKTIMFLQ